MNQDGRMRVVLLRLELVSQGATQAWNPSGGQSGEPDDRVVAQVANQRENPPHLRWRIIYDRQYTDMGREAVIADATRELEAWTRRTAPRIEGKSLIELILEDGVGWAPEVVAQRYGVDPAFVRRKRMVAGKGSEDGRDVEPDPVGEDRSGKARELRRRGMSTRQIAMILGVSQSAVMKWTRKTAA